MAGTNVHRILIELKATILRARTKMDAKVLEILERTRPNTLALTALADFRVREVTHAPRIDPCSLVIATRHLAPYCLSHADRHMVFAETPESTDLSAAPFLYQRQFETATQLVSLPYEAAHRAARALGSRPAGHLILVHSVSRSGSTLVSKMWNAVDGTLSLSEPDVFTHISLLWRLGRLDDEEATRLFETSARLHCRPARPCARFVLKFRSACIESSILMHRAFPEAAFLFVYRNAIDSIDSQLRVFGERPAPHPSACADWGPEAQAIAEPAFGRLARPLFDWVRGVRSYLHGRRRGVPFAALKYEALVGDPRRSASRMLGLGHAPESEAEAACRALTDDSQRGTLLARNADGARTITRAEEARVRSYVEWALGLSPDATLPGTLNG